MRALRRLKFHAEGVDVGRSSRGAWRIARHAVMHEALNNQLFKRYQFVLPSDLAG